MKLLCAAALFALVTESISFGLYCPSSVKCPANDPKDVVQLPNPDDCHSFCKCSHGKAFYQQCPGDLLYNPKLRVCDYPQNVHCHRKLSDVMVDASNRCPASVSKRCPRVDPSTPVYLPYPGDCHRFCQCSGGIAFAQRCPGDLVYDRNLHVCTFPSEAKCRKSDVEAVEGGHRQCPASVSKRCPKVDRGMPAYFPYPGDCHDFCECSNGVAYRFSCADGLVYNPHLKGCDYPGGRKCESNPEE